MSSLSCGIVGLPNAGKSTLFNALASRRLAETAVRPFTTIEPHEAVVAVLDERLDRLAKILSETNKSPNISVSQYPNIPEIVPATVTFIDIAGLVKGAHKGEGLGNQFLAKIREVDAIVHVVRAFNDPSVQCVHHAHDVHNINDMLEDIEIVNLELELGDITGKPTIYVLNVDEDKINNFELIAAVEEKFHQKALTISAKLEEELIDFSEKERNDYLKEVGLEKTGLERLIIFTYDLLDLITFYTIKGGKEIHAWSLKRGSSALDAAGKVHSDFAKNFIKAEVINVDELISPASGPEGLRPGGVWKEAKDKGKVRLEGKDYVVQDKDVIEFKVGN